MSRGALKSQKEFNAQMENSSSAAGRAFLWSREGKSDFWLQQGGGVFWIQVFVKSTVSERACGWSYLLFGTSSKNPELVFSSSQTFFLFYLFLTGVAFPWQRAEEVTFSFNLAEPDLSSPAAQRIFSLTQKQTMLLIEESGFKMRSLCHWRSSLWRYSGTAGFHSFLWLALFDLIVQSPASTFWPPGSVVHTRQAVIYGLIWQLLETLGRKEKWGLGHFCFFYFKNNLNLPSSKASSAFEPKLF